jgi:2-polyprenyl-3-methyl-5-hydroxy-6-metoxy-1,4-benzoquinol methylase
MPAIETSEVVCDLCGSDDATILFEAIDRLHGIEGRFTYVRCNECGLVRMNPQVVPESIGRLYPQSYAPHADKTKTSRGVLMAVRDGLRKIPLLGTELRRLTDARVMAPLARRLSADARLLDVGCGSGAFLDAVRADTGCHVQGVDVSHLAVETARRLYGVDVFEGPITEAPFADATFDAITAWWYLEHVAKPSEAVAGMSRLLKPGGTCVIGVPNFDSLFAGRFRDKWYHLDCPRHMCIWTPKTIRQLLAQHDLSVTRIYYDRSPWGLLGSLQYYFYGDNANPKHRNRIRQSALLWLLFLPLTIAVSLLRWSDIIVVYAKKTRRPGAGRAGDDRPRGKGL